MTKLTAVELVIEKSEQLGWVVSEECNGVYEFSKNSPAGHDFNFMVDSESNDKGWLVDNIHEVYSNFDVSEETYVWLDETGHGTNGAPYDMRDLYNDMESCQEMILELYHELMDI